MERLNWHMAEELAKVAEVRIIGPEGSRTVAPTGIEVREAPLKPLWKFLLRARTLARREARVWRPHIVLAGSGLTAPIAHSAARACGARAVVYVHGLDVAIKHAAYRALWLPAIRRMNRVIANSGATVELCRRIGVDPARIGLVHPGVSLPAIAASIKFSPDDGRCEVGPDVAFHGRYKLNRRSILLSVGRLSARKGLREFVTRALPSIVAVRPDIVLLIVGDAPKQALYAETQTAASIQAAAEAAGVGEHVRFLGLIADAELDTLYRTANTHVFPVREIPGDPEGFGMVAVEAAAHGLPTVAFATGGVMDAVAEGKSGHLVSPGDYAKFADAVLATIAERNTLRDSCIAFAQGFAWPKFGAKISEQLGLTGYPKPLHESMP